MSQISEEKIGEFFVKSGWNLHLQDKIRGLRPDIVMSKNGKLAVVEVKGSKGNVNLGIEQALHFKNSADYSYLALSEEVITKDLLDLCKSLGLGLVSVGKKTRVLVEPIQSQALQSVKNRIFSQKAKEKPKVQIKTSLERLFKSKNLVLMLKLLFWNSTTQFHSNDIARRTGISPSTVSKELTDILPLGIVSKSLKGNMVLYQINKHNVIYNELRQVFLKFEFVDELISKDLEEFDIKFALIFGSFAKGTEAESSDVDLLIIGNVQENQVLRSMSKVETQIGREINVIVWQENEFYQKSKDRVGLLEEIVKNQVIMLLGDENEFKRSIK
jgi:predicted nucleotidyltransferase